MPRTRDLGDNSLTKAQIKYVKAKLRNIMRQKAALDLENTNWFTTETARLAPEQYINVEMIKAKIMNNEYRTLNDIRDDFELLVGNVVWVLVVCIWRLSMLVLCVMSFTSRCWVVLWLLAVVLTKTRTMMRSRTVSSGLSLDHAR
jgi:hypothetical protein